MTELGTQDLVNEMAVSSLEFLFISFIPDWMLVRPENHKNPWVQTKVPVKGPRKEQAGKIGKFEMLAALFQPKTIENFIDNTNKEYRKNQDILR